MTFDDNTPPLPEKISGWLFFNLERTRLVFVADGLEVEEHFDWDVLLHGDCLDNFVRATKAVPTKEGPLKGYRIDVPLLDVRKWLEECAEQHANEDA